MRLTSIAAPRHRIVPVTIVELGGHQNRGPRVRGEPPTNGSQFDSVVIFHLPSTIRLINHMMYFGSISHWSMLRLRGEFSLKKQVYTGVAFDSDSIR